MPNEEEEVYEQKKRILPTQTELYHKFKEKTSNIKPPTQQEAVEYLKKKIPEKVRRVGAYHEVAGEMISDTYEQVKNLYEQGKKEYKSGRYYKNYHPEHKPNQKLSKKQIRKLQKQHIKRQLPPQLEQYKYKSQLQVLKPISINMPIYPYGNRFSSLKSPNYQEQSQFGRYVVPYRPVGIQQSFLPNVAKRKK